MRSLDCLPEDMPRGRATAATLVALPGNKKGCVPGRDMETHKPLFDLPHAWWAIGINKAHIYLWKSEVEVVFESCGIQGPCL